MNNIIDTAQFQRLRRITQTSYSPLYSSAVHNRFVHSLGVYNLGVLAGDILEKEAKNLICKKKYTDFSFDDLSSYNRAFQLACLLHDVGHSPFSHTGEDFYLGEERTYDKLHHILMDIISSEEFSKDVPTDKSKAAAPHEIMSAIVAITNYGAIIGEEQYKEFFARCITGYQYTIKNFKNNILNCYIQLLNSKIIDVDKLDYLIRDAYITGFSTVSIDYIRLLSSLTIAENINDSNGDEQELVLAYYKGAVSVIENVVYAHDSERKWIQSHPVILYESYVLQHIIEWLCKTYNDKEKEKELFSLNSLSVEGTTLKYGIKVRLLCDDDMIFLAKTNYDKFKLIEEFFDRRKRRHPLWKSEAEYKAFLLGISSGGSSIDNLEKAMKSTAEYLSKSNENWVIDKRLQEKLEKEIFDLQELKMDDVSKRTQLLQKNNILKVVKCLMEYAQKIHYDGDFVLLKSSQFNSGFLKPDFSDIKIVFPSEGEDKIVKFGEKISSISGVTKDRDDFFYIFYNRTEEMENRFDVNELCKDLFRAFV